MEQEVQVLCPICNKEHPAQVKRVIENTEDNQVRGKLMDRSYFDFQCPECGHFSQLRYNCLYQEKDIREYLYLSSAEPQKEGDLQRIEQEAQTFLTQSSETEHGSKDGIYRIVFSQEDLREKILIFENGMDDRIVEICKGIALSQFPADDKFYVEDIRYDLVGEREVLRLKCSDDSEQYVLDFPSMYEQMYEAYGAMLPPVRDHYFKCIDMEFAAQLLRGLEETA